MCCTLCLSIRLCTMSLSPLTGTSSASWGSALYSQSFRAWRASVNRPENSSASSSLCCLKENPHVGQFQNKYNFKRTQIFMGWYLSMDLPLIVSHVSLSSANKFTRCCWSWLVWALSWRLRPLFSEAAYMGLFDLSSFWNPYLKSSGSAKMVR